MAIRREMQFTSFDRAVTKLLQAASFDDHPIRMQRGRVFKVRFATATYFSLSCRSICFGVHRSDTDHPEGRDEK